MNSKVRSLITNRFQISLKIVLSTVCIYDPAITSFKWVKYRFVLVVNKTEAWSSDCWYSMAYCTGYLALALSFHALIFITTLITTFNAAQQFDAQPWLRVIQRDGVLYFVAIFSSTLIWLLFGEWTRVGSLIDNTFLWTDSNTLEIIETHQCNVRPLHPSTDQAQIWHYLVI